MADSSGSHAHAIEAMDEAHRLKVCRLVAGIVVTDDDFAPAEEEFVNRMLARFGFGPGERDSLFPIVDAAEAAEEFGKLAPAVQDAVFALLVEAACADGRIADEERHYLEQVAATMSRTPAWCQERIAAHLAGG